MASDRVKDLRRRRFLKTAAATASLAGAAGCGASKEAWRFFTAAEARTVSAIAERIIPSDEWPGAAWAGIATFMDRQLAGHYRKFRSLYRDGLAGLEEASRAAFGSAFADLSTERQTELLRQIEKGKATGATWKKVSPQQFFTTLVTHTMQGFYGDPRHGGNREGVGYRMLGVPASPVRGRAQHDLTQKGGPQA